MLDFWLDETGRVRVAQISGVSLGWEEAVGMKTQVCHVWAGPWPRRGVGWGDGDGSGSLALCCHVWVCRGRPETGH